MIMQYFLIALTVWRICFLLKEDIGPRDIFIFLRYKIGIYYIVNNKPISYLDMVQLEKSGYEAERLYKNWIAEAIDCYYCSSIWVSFFLSVLFFGFNINTIYYTLSLSTCCIMINYLHEHLRGGIR